MPRKTTTKPAPTKPADDDVDELEELDEISEIEEVPAEKPAKAKKASEKKAAADKPAFGTSELAAHVSEQTGKSYDNKAIRVLLRKLANDGTLKRTVGEDRSRYAFTGPDDPQVKAIVEAVKSGALEKEKKAKLEELKAKKAAEKGTKGKAKAEPAAAVEEAEDVDDEDISDLEDDDE